MSPSQQITPKEFRLFQELIYDEFGISLSDKKVTLMQTRLRKWMQNLEMKKYHELYDYLQSNPHDLMLLADAITTNVTSFFREKNQWVYLKSYLPRYNESKHLRIWSAACSSGQEPYSITMFLNDLFPNFSSWNFKLLATDLSKEILQKAITGEYREKDLEGVSKQHRSKYFTPLKKPEKCYVIKDFLKENILFRQFNLVTGNYHLFKNQFDIIFCRNVMIYFDQPTQDKVTTNLIRLLKPGGLLLIGHSESITNRNSNIQAVSPAVYIKKGI